MRIRDLQDVDCYEASTEPYDFHARHYDLGDGRFLSEDPIKGSPRKPQTLNPYACSANSPLAHPDPSGLYPDDYYGEDGSGGEDTSSSEEDTSSDGEEYTGEEDDATSPEEEGGGEDCSQYIPENAQVPSEEDPQVPNEDREGPVQENIAESEESSTPEFIYNARPNLGSLDPGGDQDYKSYVDEEEDPQLYEDYAAYGNFNFGATGAAQGYDADELQQIGGADQAVTGPKDPEKDYTASELYRGGLGDISQADEADDREQIQAGYDYYNCLEESGF